MDIKYYTTYQDNNTDIKKPLVEELQEHTDGMNIKELKKFLNKHLPSLEQRLSGRIGIGFQDIKGDISDFYINGKKSRWAASTIKIPVMIATMRAVDNNTMRLDDKLIVNHRYTLEEGDWISTLPDYTAVPVHNLLYHMIISSDNEATNMLANRLGLEYINATTKSLGTKRTMLAHLLAYNVPRIRKFWNPDGSNLTTAKDMTILLSSIYNGTAASTESCDMMKHWLEKSSFKPLRRLLPEGTVVGNKIGATYDFQDGDDFHDVGVINREYVLSVMCSKIKPKLIKKHTDKADRILDNFFSYDLLDYEIPEYEEYVYDKNCLHAPEIISAVSKIVYNAYQQSKVGR